MADAVNKKNRKIFSFLGIYRGLVRASSCHLMMRNPCTFGSILVWKPTKTGESHHLSFLYVKVQYYQQEDPVFSTRDTVFSTQSSIFNKTSRFFNKQSSILSNRWLKIAMAQNYLAGVCCDEQMWNWFGVEHLANMRLQSPYETPKSIKGSQHHQPFLRVNGFKAFIYHPYY